MKLYYWVADEATTKLKKELERALISQERPAFSCNCGTHQYGKARCVAVSGPHERGYPELVYSCLAWTASMRDEQGRGYALGIANFLGMVEAQELIARFFSDKATA